MNVSEILTHCSPVVENIFRYLSVRDLSRCAQVCKMWNSMSENENKRRLFMEWFLQHGKREHYQGMFECLPSGKYSFQERMLDTRTKAATCFCLLTIHLMDHPAFTKEFKHQPPFKRTKMGKYDKKKHQLMSVADHYLKPCLPNQCQLFCMSSAGVIGTQGNQAPVEVEVGAAIAGILIPHFPGMEIHHMAIEKDTLYTAQEFPKMPIKCLLMFMGPFPDYIQPFVDHSVANQSEKFALGGALVAAPATGLGSCFAFTGENVEAASILIDNSVEDISAELQCFEQTDLLRNQCICFAFTCIEKGVRKYKTSNYESDLFHKIYPNVPLVGVFGYGEIGAYHMPNVQGEVHQQRTKRFGYKKCLRSHSTTFVLVSVKKTNQR